MAAKHIGLGRGLGALIKDTPPAAAPVESGAVAAEPAGERVLRVAVERIHQSRWQPRQRFAADAIEELAQSIREKGVLQPLTVRRTGETFELIAGERRWRAAQAAGLKDVPVLVMEATDQQALEMALVENLQREDLNIMEEAEGYRLLAEKFALTQEQIAMRVGKARATVANALRLLKLPASIQASIREGRLSVGHAKVILGLASAALGAWNRHQQKSTRQLKNGHGNRNGISAS